MRSSPTLFFLAALTLVVTGACSGDGDSLDDAGSDTSSTGQDAIFSGDSVSSIDTRPQEDTGGNTSTTKFVERDGYIVMEMESTPITGDLEWESATAISDFRGSGYYSFSGNGICSGPANSPLSYSFEVTKEATYELRLRAAKINHCVAWKTPEDHSSDSMTSTCNHTAGTCDSLARPSGDRTCPDPTKQCFRQDISNDAFVRILDAEGQYLSFVGQPGSSVGEGIKLFGGQPEQWAFTGTKALDTNGQKFNAHWVLAPGEYSLVIEGRSQGFSIDRVVLFDKDEGTIRGAEDLPETLRE